MRILCPSCAAEYDVPESRMTPGRMVRCSRCGGEWVPVIEPEPQEATADLVDAATQPTDQPVVGAPTATAMDRLAASARPPPRSMKLIVAWVLTFVVIGLAIAATLTWRNAVVQAWPAGARLLGQPESAPVPAKPSEH